VLAVNIGGIANFTALPRGGAIDALIGMDCGPGNMVLDGLVERFSLGAERLDRGGRMASRGRVREPVLDLMKAHPFFAQAPPRSAGREQFGQDFLDMLLEKVAPDAEQDWCDLLASAAELTAFGIHESYLRHVAPAVPVDTVVVSGGGARNPEILRRLAARFAPVPVRPSDAYGLPVDAKEAIAFAVLASDRIDDRPANVPSVTGAGRRARLGKITEV
jgi:anhydro-N-acetylmuramic acid kinase